MAALIPISKQTKKSRKLFYRKYRGDWQGVNPATRVMQSKKYTLGNAKSKTMERNF